jgi:hypothetical protein
VIFSQRRKLDANMVVEARAMAERSIAVALHELRVVIKLDEIVKGQNT